MDPLLVSIALLGAVVFILSLALLKRRAFVPEGQANQLLRSGAVIVDVRTAEEFKRGHVPEAVNAPLNELPGVLSHLVSAKDKPLLVHCLAGGRSALAKRILLRNGYTQVFNLGSYGRAVRIFQSFQGHR